MSDNGPTHVGKIVEFLYRAGIVDQSGSIKDNPQLNNLVVELTYLAELDYDIDLFFKRDRNLKDYGFNPQVMMDDLIEEFTLPPYEVNTANEFNKKVFNFSGDFPLEWAKKEAPSVEPK